MSRPRIPSPRTLAFAVLVAVLAAGCGGDSPAEPEGMTLSDLVGSWKASSAVFTSQANPALQYDIVGGGGELRVTVLPEGRSRTWVELGDFSDEWDAQLSLSGNRLTAVPAESSRPTRRYTIEMDGANLRLTSTDATFDFSLSGGAGSPANEVVILVRQ